MALGDTLLSNGDGELLCAFSQILVSTVQKERKYARMQEYADLSQQVAYKVSKLFSHKVELDILLPSRSALRHVLCSRWLTWMGTSTCPCPLAAGGG